MLILMIFKKSKLNQKFLLPIFIKINFVDTSNGNPVTLVYKGEFGNEAVLTYKKHSLYGRVILNDDRTFIIETVAEGVVWAEIGELINTLIPYIHEV